ncbi:hypothetical protein F8568_022510 [Actinomadura sp. LD22]|uniref:Uncharacterized protein n=1 Tax=Actinomadura physcomitrii TaxID=2650748 RepID=A0A6I4MF06_9ACTN|nr:hypothetical protein [Actinomadura physcomitrii]MWA02331.1 hypothetical protein [Actinomadura physcomitrii]MWA03097.1 hypothetical protein [Actinomadura physcomitrii]
MTAPAWTADVEDSADLEERLRAEFPGWRIARAGGSWWASRTPLLSETVTAADSVQAPSAAELYLALDRTRS